MTIRRAVLLVAGLLLCLPAVRAANVKLGIDVLEEHHFAELQGMRVGLITNATGIDSRGVSTIDVLRNAPGVQLVALFGPEHGVYGTDWAGQYVASATDPHTGLPVYSLYGPTRKPTAKMLEGLDALVYDIQDIGCRSYTFISTLGLAMEAAGEAGIKFYVLDRPDPLNGNRVEGPMVNPGYHNFTAQWNVPYVYGMTPGELAYMIRETPGWIKKAAPPRHSAGSPVNIVRMEGWYRSMYFEDTGLMWVPTSPHIPTAETSLSYVATGFLGEAGGIDNGVGYTLPFAVFGHPSFDSFGTASHFNQLQLPGVYFEPVTFKPFYSLFKNQAVNGAQVYFTDRDKANLCNLGVQILHFAYHSPGTRMFRATEDGASGPDVFDRIAGGPELRTALESGETPDQIIQSWQPALAAFRQARRPYLLYGDRPKSDTGN